VGRFMLKIVPDALRSVCRVGPAGRLGKTRGLNTL